LYGIIAFALAQGRHFVLRCAIPKLRRENALIIWLNRGPLLNVTQFARLNSVFSDAQLFKPAMNPMIPFPETGSAYTFLNRTLTPNGFATICEHLLVCTQACNVIGDYLLLGQSRSREL